MPTVTVRLSEKEKRELLKRAKTLSSGIREGINLYVRNEKRREILERLGELQRKNRIHYKPQDVVRLIREDRRSR
ncbi:MAG TPA: hypothetical protein VED17_03055 [Nitrososphaerales archaeon]|nr:hypothetical protein [Nitrososphaerales archaeon]